MSDNQNPRWEADARADISKRLELAEAKHKNLQNEMREVVTTIRCLENSLDLLDQISKLIKGES